MTTKREVVIKDDGQIIRRTVNEEKLAIADDIVDSLSDDVCRRANRVAKTHFGYATLEIDNANVCWWSIALKYLPLKTAYAMHNGVMVPVWINSGQDVDLVLDWTPPSTMRLYLLFKLVRDVGFSMEAGWLFAQSEDTSYWRLPVGNLYDDCHLCMGTNSDDGEFNGSANTSVECLEKCVTQFKDAVWNADLTDRHNTEQSRAMFRFQSKDEGFKQLDPSVEWTSCCNKVVVDSITKHIPY